MLGVSRNHAHTLLSRAREQLETCLAVLLVGRAGRGECDELDTMLAGWDGRLTVAAAQARPPAHRVLRDLRRQAGPRAAPGHAARPVARRGARGRGGVSLRLAPGAPDGLRAHTITFATGHGVGRRRAPRRRAQPGGGVQPQRVPQTGPRGQGPGWRRTAAAGGAGGATGRDGERCAPPARGVAAVTAAVVIAAVIAAVAFALTGNTRTLKPAADPSRAGRGGAGGRHLGGRAVGGRAGASAAAGQTGPAAHVRPPPRLAPTATATAGTDAEPAAEPDGRGPAERDADHRQPDGVRQHARARRPARCRSTLHGGTLVLGAERAPGRQIDLSGSGSGRHWDVHWSVAVANDPDDAISVSSSAGNPDVGRPDGRGDGHRQSVSCPAARRGLRRSRSARGGAVYSVCTSGSALRRRRLRQADDDAAYTSLPGRDPAEDRAGPLRGRDLRSAWTRP